MFTTILNTDLQLALIQPSFAKDYYQLVQQERDYLQIWLPWVHRANDEKFFQEFIQEGLLGYARSESLHCAIFYQQQLAGHISLVNLDHTFKKTTIGYWLARNFQGKGIIHQSLEYLLELANNNYAMELAIIRTADNNEKSQAVAKRLGFQYDGILKRGQMLNGKMVDLCLFSRLL